MKRLVLLLCLLFVLPNIDPVYPGMYFYSVNAGYCFDQDACLHEIGHAIDDASGSISQTEAFKVALAVYLKTADVDDFYMRVVNITLRSEHNQAKELYAWIFAWSDGDVSKIPEQFRPLYNETLVNRYILKVENHILRF